MLGPGLCSGPFSYEAEQCDTCSNLEYQLCGSLNVAELRPWGTAEGTVLRPNEWISFMHCKSSTWIQVNTEAQYLVKAGL